MAKSNKSIIPTRSIRRRLKEYLSVDEEKALCNYMMQQFPKNRIKAMVDAGYTEMYARSHAKKLFNSAKAKKFLAEKIDQALLPYNKGADDILKEVALIAFSDPADLFIDIVDKEGKKGGIALKNIFEMGPSRRTIKEIKHHQVVHYDKDGEKDWVENTYEYRLHDKVQTLKILAEYHKIINNRSEGGSGGETVQPLLYLPDNGRDIPEAVVV